MPRGSDSSDRTSSDRIDFGPAVVPLLALSVFIAYIDRGNLATAGPLIQDEVHLSSTELGALLSSFYWTYVPGQILAASLAERLTPYRVLTLGVGLWSVATAGSGLAGGFVSLLVLRLLLGLAESAAYPCSSKLLAQHLPVQKLGMANAQIQLGVALGPAFGTFVGGHVMAHFGWRATFLGFGLASLLWLVPWRAATRHASARARRLTVADAPTYAEILRRRAVWGTSLGAFCFTYPLYVVIYWLPLYLVRAHGFSVAHMATMGGLVYVANAASSLLTGFACDRLMHAGATASVRKIAMVASGALTTASFVAVAFGSAAVAVGSLCCVAFALGLAGPNVFAIPQTLAGPRAAGKWVGVQNCAGNLSGIVAPIVTGYVVDRTGQFFWAFVLAGAVALVGTLAWALMVPRIAPLDWAPRSS
jgi:MFS family permease